jgi:hypothetical protein
MDACFIYLFCPFMAGAAIDLQVILLHLSSSVSIIKDPGMTIRAGELAVNRLLVFALRDKKGEDVSTGVFFSKLFIPMATETP